MTDILEQIVADKRIEIAAAKQAVPVEVLKERVAGGEKARNFFKAMTRPADEVRVIAEVKKASPSAGLIRADFDPVMVAKAYEGAGAACISCLTDQKYFQGDLGYIAQIKAAVDLPVLRKDFIVDTYQVWEARAAGADAILLIGECLEEHELIDLMILATELGMTTLLEVHDVDNLLKVRPHIGFPHPKYVLLGINNRNLKTMTTDINHTIRLLDLVEQPEILVTESGIKTHADVQKMMRAGINKFLVGEHLMKQDDIGAALGTLING
ncbi:indole-3-glycerol phosphate synthase TrpC [Poriferisphaera sp. WC338]|uniref:indole-3-glycerol phosphate synthase TrpC n=1 Tax=Poriferisphaera sp. WC338 TaxID=3425129 RepID=UPI003D8141C8